MNSSEYQVTIKSANQKVDDYVTKCSSSWTVQRLKQHISETHVNKPRVEDQRLIYAGNLLKDSWFLRQIFFRDSLCTELTNSSKTDFTIHLVCYTPVTKTTASTSSSSSASQSRPANNNGQSNNTSSTARPTSSSDSSNSNSGQTQSNIDRTQPAANPAPPLSSNSQNRHQNQQQASNNTNTPIILANNPSQTPTFSSTQHAEMIQNYMQSEQMRQQMAIFQHLAHVVAAQIANHVANSRNPTAINSDQASQVPTVPIFDNQALNVQTIASLTSNHLSATASQMLYAGNRQQTQFVQADTSAGVYQNENMNNENNANAQGVVGEPAVVDPQLRRLMQARAPGGGFLEQAAPPPDPELQHDVIDWAYYSIRAAVLLVALYLHATWFRLLFIFTLLAMAYFFNRRRFPARQGQQQQVGQDNPVFQPPDQGQPDVIRRNLDGDGQQRAGANIVDDTDEMLQDRVQEETVPVRVPFLKLCYLVVTEFLASLVPE